MLSSTSTSLLKRDLLYVNEKSLLSSEVSVSGFVHVCMLVCVCVGGGGGGGRVGGEEKWGRERDKLFPFRPDPREKKHLDRHT